MDTRQDHALRQQEGGRPIKMRPRGVPVEDSAHAACRKDIDAVMLAQQHLVNLVHTLRQVVCVKS